MRQIVHIISMWYKETIMLPLFMQHYSGVDCFTILEDDEPSMNDQSKVDRLNKAANESKADVRIVVDADEFIYPIGDWFVEPGKVYSAGFWEVFRHRSDSDVDSSKPPLQQRKHGNQIRGECFGQRSFVKPIVFGRGVEIKLSPGNHSADGVKPVHGMFDGSHWAMSDRSIALDRRMRKKARQSEYNMTHGLTSHDWHITETEIIAECNKHLDDPVVIKTSRKGWME